MRTRIVSAVILAPVVLALIGLGGFPYRALVAIAGFLMLFEWVSITGRQWEPNLRVASYGLAALTMGALFFSGAGMLALIFIVIGMLALFGAGIAYNTPRWPVAGYLYASLAAFSLIYLREGEGTGLLAIAYLFVLVWATDIFAYFVGKTLKGPKLAPSISPGKTISGAVGGLILAVACTSVFLLSFSVALSAGAIALMAVLSIVSQAGDLFESWVKRRFGVKDSGWIIPGHGGILDRVDGLVAAAIAMALLGWLIGYQPFA
ncbi:phosphatidate cytidylyltransferase [Limoniibacter endophyticus]|uniref:Phosphatidate cytidylyltransferase n=2 Tax=Limoniibacter endophyticus TaxID=1565040 RepID=A0A8J3DG17_9HYPH|nr:phosphatidate cytidylyltransferase [Limoniibacter endophyticus]